MKFKAPVWLGVAAVWFGMHAGGGFASGQQEVRYFLIMGWTAVLMPFVAETIQGIVNYFAWDYSRLTKSYDFRTWVDRFYHPYDKFFANVLDFFFIIFLCLPTGAAIAGAASLLTVEFGMPYVAATLISCAFLFFTTIFGSGLVRTASTFMIVVLLVCLLAIVIFGIASNHETALEVINNRTFTPGEGGWLVALKMALLYAAFQASIGPLVSVAETLKTRADVVKTTICGILLNGIPLALICFMLLGAYPEVLSKDIPLPVLHVLNTLDMPILKAAYTVVLFFAFISTGVAFVFASVRRFENSKVWNICSPQSLFGRSIKARNMLVSILTMLYALGAAQFGLVAIVGKGYSYMGWAYLVLIVIPIIGFGTLKCRQAERALKAGENK